MKLRFAQNLKTLRTERNMTQETLAEKLGVSSQSVSRWETGATYPDIELLPIIASVFDVSVDSLLDSDEAARRHRAYETIDNLNYFATKQERIEAMRRAYLENQNDPTVKIFYFQELADHNNPPEMIAEAKRLGYEMLEDPSNFPRSEYPGIVVSLTEIESEENLPALLSKYTSGPSFDKGHALKIRYIRRGEDEKAFHQAQLNSFARMDYVFKHFSNLGADIRKIGNDRLYKYSEQVFAVINALSGVCDPQYPVSGDGNPDIFMEWRSFWGRCYAVTLAGKGEKERMYAVLRDLIDLQTKIWMLPDGTKIDNRGGIFDGIDAVIEPERRYRENRSKDDITVREVLALYDGDTALAEVFDHTIQRMMETHEAFECVREEAEFKDLLDKARDLKIVQTSFAYEVIYPIKE